MRIPAYVRLVKPRQTLLLAYSSLVAYLAAALRVGALNTYLLMISTSAVVLAIAGTNALNNYLDRDIDSIMERTRHRPIPSGEISPGRALAVGALLVMAGTLLTLIFINLIASVLLVLGVLIDLVVYTKWLKRKNPVNILIGSFAGGALPLYGWSSYTGEVASAVPWLISALIVVWTPSHIWSIAFYYKEDYSRAKVPMLPVVFEEKKAIQCMASTVPIILLITVLLGYVGRYGPVYWILTVLGGVPYLYLGLKSMISPSRELYWRLFKYSSPYLALALTAPVLALMV